MRLLRSRAVLVFACSPLPHCRSRLAGTLNQRKRERDHAQTKVVVRLALFFVRVPQDLR